LTITQFTQVGLEQIGLKKMAFAACPHPPYSYDLMSSDFELFPIVKEKFERIQLADEDQFFESLEDISRRLDQYELNILPPSKTSSVQQVLGISTPFDI
jgi:hypothetical protein